MTTELGRGELSGGGPASTSVALSLVGITKTFGDFVALNSVDFDLRQGEVHALLGENGAGKSTLMNVAAGLYDPDRGTIRIAGKQATIDGPSDAHSLGIGMVHQHYKLVLPFDAVDNILLGNPLGRYRDAQPEMRRRILETAASIGFDITLDRPVGDFSVAEQQRIEILKVLVAGASIIILDEPTAVLTDEEAERLLKAVRKLAASGSSVVLVTHKLNEALGFSDRITVMRGGHLVGTVTPAEVSAGELTKMIVGETIIESAHRSEVIGKPHLLVRDVSAQREDGLDVLKNISFNVRAGEIYGVAGVGGNGQTELVQFLTGLVPATRGGLFLDGQGDITASTAHERRAYGLACIPSDRHTYALAGGLSVTDNFSISGVLSGQFGSWFRVNRGKAAKATRAAVKAFDVQGVRHDAQRAALLSGGNAQKLVIAREFSGEPSVVIAHSPNRGLDVRASAAVHDQLRRARDRGAAVILISEDLDEIMLLSDRIGVMASGAIVSEFDTPADRHEIGKAMVGHD
jgi:ABC-type uncharacterized transport system ATPase subunit